MRDLMIDCADPHTLASFWSAILRRPVEGGAEGPWVSLPEGNQPSMIFFRKVTDAKQVKNRLHLDLNPVDGTLAAEVRAAHSPGCHSPGQVRPGVWSWLVRAGRSRRQRVLRAVK